jgi:hypothetical protein
VRTYGGYVCVGLAGKKLVISIRVGHQMFLANKGDQELQVGWGSTVMGFGKGKWKKGEEGHVDSDKRTSSLNSSRRMTW